MSAIEVDLSKFPRDAARRVLERAILISAPREWLYNPKLQEGAAILEKRRRERRARDAERAAQLANLYASACGERGARRLPGNAIDKLARFGLSEAIRIQVSGGGCFSVDHGDWQAAILLDAVERSGPRLPTITPERAARSLTRRGWLNRKFISLRDTAAAAIQVYEPSFRQPEETILEWAMALSELGLAKKMDRGVGWVVVTEPLERRANAELEAVRLRKVASQRILEIQLALGAAFRDAPAQEWVAFCFDNWLNQPIPGRSYSVRQAVQSDELFRAFTCDLTRMLTLLRFRPRADLDLLGLPLSGTLARRLANGAGPSASAPPPFAFQC